MPTTTQAPSIKVKPLLYRPPPKWHLWSALGGALLIHIGAVLAAMKREGPPVTLEKPAEQIVEATIQEEPQPTPPPEEIVAPEPPPPPPEQIPEYVEERTPPPRQPKPAATIAPVKQLPMSSAKALAVYAPKPPYPYEARAHHIMGSGVCVLSVNSATGQVTDASMSQSIGNRILDDATTSTFRNWRFRPGTVSKVRVPITYTMTGASY
jgi:TonB family protein